MQTLLLQTFVGDVCNNFPFFSVGGKPLQFVTEFKYLGHVLLLVLILSDDKDLQREMRNMYTYKNKYSSA